MSLYSRRPNYSFLARTISALNLVQVSAVTVPEPAVSPISDAIFEASSGLGGVLRHQHFRNIGRLGHGISKVQAAQELECVTVKNTPTARTDLNIGHPDRMG